MQNKVINTLRGIQEAIEERAVNRWLDKEELNKQYEEKLDSFIKERDAFYLEQQVYYNSLNQEDKK